MCKTLENRLTAVALTLLVSGCGVASGNEDHPHSAEAANHDGVPLYENLGSHARVVPTTPVAQAYFNQGLRLQYAFNHDEAIRSYEAALAEDPTCAMCWWGIALASGPNINGAMDPQMGSRAFRAIGRAQERAPGNAEVDVALIEAMARRYGVDSEVGRSQLDSAYATAMAVVAARFPEDADVQTLYAASLMNLRPWNYWAGDYGSRRPNPGTEDILRALEAALRTNAENPGACHYFIHAVEAAYPERAVACADRIAKLMPGAGHIVHMPGHIYIRVGRYADAVKANEHAVHSDETYIADQSPMGVYPAAYYPHNYHFMAFAATMAGMSEKAAEASRIVAPKVPKEIALEVMWIQNAVVFPHLTAVTFGDWEKVLELPMPDPELAQSAAMAWYARGVAHAATGDEVQATQALQKVNGIRADVDPGGENPVFAIAGYALAGEIAARAGDPAAAAVLFQAAADVEDEMLYEEPPLWYYPIRHSLGKALLEAGRPVEAEAAYRDDLARFPENGWSLYGLAQSLEAQGKDASDVHGEFQSAWRHADVDLVASRY